MGTAYDPYASDYVDELAVRHETARVFDVCVSCQKCVDTCAVFPLMITSVDNCVERDASLLTPSQQDDVINVCHQCTKCITYCPYLDEPVGQAVNVPALVIRHRAMLKKNNFLTMRQQISEEILTRVATHMSWSRPFRFIGAQLLRYATSYVPALLYRQLHDTRQHSTMLGTIATTREVSFFPTCVIDAYAPETGLAIQQVFAQAGAQCVRGKEHNCCGAPDLYNGNTKRFTRIVAKNVRAFRASLDQGRRVVVGQQGCLHVMREHYGDFSNDPFVSDVVGQLQDPWEFLAEMAISESSKTFSPPSRNTSLTLFQSSMASRSDGAHLAQELLMRWGWQVQLIEIDSGPETMWEIHTAHTDAISSQLAQLTSHVESVAEAGIVSESCLTNVLLNHNTSLKIRHPFEVLAEQL